MEPPPVRLPRSRNIFSGNRGQAPRPQPIFLTDPTLTSAQAQQARRQFSGNHILERQCHMPVYRLTCNDCSASLCARGMRVNLAAHRNIELYSTDAPSRCVYMLETDIVVASCQCRIRKVACLECGNIVGYHITAPCIRCFDSFNNGHFWMFHATACQLIERTNINDELVFWGGLPKPESDMEFIMGDRPIYEQFCR